MPPAVIPPTVRSYAQAATSSLLDGADWVYGAKGGAPRPMAEKYSSPFKVLERGNKAWKQQVGERVNLVRRDRLKPHLGSVAPRVNRSFAHFWLKRSDSLGKQMSKFPTLKPVLMHIQSTPTL